MNHTIQTSTGIETLPNNLGYVVSCININRLTNTVISSIYYYSTEMMTPLIQCKQFYNYNDLLAHINTIKESLVLVDDEQL